MNIQSPCVKETKSKWNMRCYQMNLAIITKTILFLLIVQEKNKINIYMRKISIQTIDSLLIIQQWLTMIQIILLVT